MLYEIINNVHLLHDAKTNVSIIELVVMKCFILLGRFIVRWGNDIEKETTETKTRYIHSSTFYS